MRKRSLTHALAALFASLLCTPALAGTAWDESADGDLSGDPDAPTALTLSSGSNLIWGSVVSPDDTRDYITFTLGAGQSLVAINLEGFIVVGPDSVGFTAINEGATSYIPSVSTAGDFLGGSHLSLLPAGTDLLSILAGAPQAGTGFDAPLGPGTYTWMVQQTGMSMIGYGVDFVVVPLPAAAWLLLAALGVLPGLRRAR